MLSSRKLFLALLTASLMLFMAPYAFGAQKGVSTAHQPDLLVFINSAYDGGMDQVSITFSSKVDHAKVKAYLNDLLQRTKWECRNLSIAEEDALPSGGGGKITSASFNTRFAVMRSKQDLPIAEILTSFKKYNRIQIYFLIGGTFNYKGFMGDFKNNDVSLNLQQHNNAYTCDAQILNHDFQTLNLPSPAQNSQQGSSGANGSKETLRIIVGILILAIFAGAMAYWIAGRYSAGRRS